MTDRSDSFRLEEYRALRATIRQRGSIRLIIASLTFSAWAAAILIVTALSTIPLVGLVPLIVLAAGFEIVFALHVASFEFLVTAAIGASRRLGASGELAAAIGLLLTAIYLALAIRRVYDGSTASMVVKTTALIALTLVANYATSLASIRLALLLV